MNTADALIQDINRSIPEPNKADVPIHVHEKPHVQGFTQ